MPLYRGTIHKTRTTDGESWSNVYDILESSADNALTDLLAWAEFEQACYFTDTKILLCNVVNVANKNDGKRGIANLIGVKDPTGLGGPLPLFLTMMVVFTDFVKKPEKKFLRGVGYRNNLALGQWSGELVGQVDSDYSAPLFGSLPFVGPSGERPTGWETRQVVVDRQLGWHRRPRPGFKRGWVPR